jgi:hypothetical protein
MSPVSQRNRAKVVPGRFRRPQSSNDACTIPLAYTLSNVISGESIPSGTVKPLEKVPNDIPFPSEN